MTNMFINIPKNETTYIIINRLQNVDNKTINIKNKQENMASTLNMQKHYMYHKTTDKRLTK